LTTTTPCLNGLAETKSRDTATGMAIREYTLHALFLQPQLRYNSVPCHSAPRASRVANEAFHGWTIISRCQTVGDPDVSNPKLAIRREQSKKKGAKIGNHRLL
jgi:hypothetical protein